jgi:hypothetical protein
MFKRLVNLLLMSIVSTRQALLSRKATVKEGL